MKRERKIRRHVLISSIKRRIRKFHVVIVQWSSNECTKKSDESAALLFAHNTYDCFDVLVAIVVMASAAQAPQ